ncbi:MULTISPECIES: hypothetical protein [Dyella]|uniref:Uncharacterized protein n=2 Tax=Dyella TaxID=231454 RepID=A0A4R0YTE6_9GAMM|nr:MULTISPECIES: hypothetical protein [Dyella]TBR39775.1 hypothetical protein EYV96_06200 [Dyella terrae]TCI12645.1 hypothetical protein EZM97_04670 [Dyella soli]
MHKPSSPRNVVDWSDPRLDALLKKTESWSLDNRGAFPEQNVQIHVGWGASTGKPARLVWERDQAVVIISDYTLPKGESVRVDRHLGDRLQSAWGAVVESRPGQRDEDQAGGLYVHWVHMR